MQNIPMAITQRLHAEYDDFDVTVPEWLYIMLMDDVYYTVSVIVISINSFGLGLLLGWICTL